MAAQLSLYAHGELLPRLVSTACRAPGVSDAEALSEKCLSLHAAGDAAGVVEAVLQGAGPGLFELGEEEGEAVFFGLFDLVGRADEAAKDGLSGKLLAALKQHGGHAALALRVLGNLLNLQPAMAATVFEAALEVARGSRDLMGTVEGPLLEHCEASGDRALLAKGAEAAEATPGMEVMSMRCLHMFVSTGSGATSEAARLLVAGLKMPVWLQKHQPDVLDLAAVKALAGSAEHGWLHELVATLLRGDLPALLALKNANAARIEAAGIDAEALLRSMRLLALCALASEKDSLSYAEVAAGLDVEVGAVEEWIVQAISEDLLEARLDQLEQVVVVQSVSFRTFGDDQWKVLQQRLKEWKDNVKAVVDTLRAAQGKQ